METLAMMLGPGTPRSNKMGLEPMDALQTVSDCFKEVREILESFKLVSSADLLSELKMYKTLQGMSFTSRLNSTILQVHDAEKQLNEHFLPQKYASGDLSIFNAHQLEMVDMFMDWHRNPKLKEQAKSARDARASGAQQQYDRANRSKFREISENAARPKNVLLPATRNIFSRTRTQHPHAHAIQGLLGAPVVFDAERLHGALAREYSQVPSVWVDTDAALDEMLLALLAEPVIAVDLEHHSFLSYHGLTCLIQISSSTRDYLVDAIKLRESLQTSCRSLNRVLANADILKLVHGAESDIEWLQRDFDTYLVNVFDSFFAAKSLNLPRCSLAFLLQKYLSVELDKKYQLADWRERPLPAEMLEYALKDTHYLFALYAELSRELNRDQMSIVLRQSNTQCLVTFAATEADEEGWKVLLERSLIPLNAEQRPLARALYYWRDERVRALDISPAAFLSNAGLLKLAQTGARTVGEVRSALRHVSQWLDLNALVDFLNNYQASAFVDAAPEEPAAETVIVETGPAEVKRVKLEAPRPSGRISFAAEQPKASASSLFAKKGGASGAAQVLSGLKEGERVSFDVAQGPKGKQAANIQSAG